MAFDSTYLTAGLSQCSLHGKHGLIGGAFDQNQRDHCFIDMDDIQVDVKSINRAKSMLEFLCWDPSGKQKLPLAVCSLPVENAYRGVHGLHRGCWAMLSIVGEVLAASANVIKGISFDAHGTHEFIRRCVHGQFEDIDLEELKEIPFFSELKHRALPPHCLPRLPIRICLHQEEVFWAVPGPCSLAHMYASLPAYACKIFQNISK